MSKKLNVLKALKLLTAVAVPKAEVVGLDGEEAAPARVPANGRIIIRTGDPGEPEIDLSPLAYNWSHRIPIEFVAVETPTLTSEEALDDMLVRFGAAIAADRHLGGLCEWLGIAAPGSEDIYTDGAEPPRGAELVLTANYVTDSELS
jgi:hypothetical protein